VRQAQAAVRSQVNQKILAQLAFFPTLTLTPGVGWQKIKQPGFASESKSWTWGGTLIQPVLSLPRLLADLKAQDARTEQAVIAYEKTVQTAFQESESALVNLDADRRRVACSPTARRARRRGYEATRIGYERGFNDLSTTLQAQQNWRVIRAQLTAAQVQALRRSVQAMKALGGGWPARPTPSDASETTPMKLAKALIPLARLLALAACKKPPEKRPRPTGRARSTWCGSRAGRSRRPLGVRRPDAARGSRRPARGHRLPVARVLADVGQYVKAGQTLVQLDPTLISAQVAQGEALAAQAEAQALQAEDQARRVQVSTTRACSPRNRSSSAGCRPAPPAPRPAPRPPA
jgi:outer membrane protein TolC